MRVGVIGAGNIGATLARLLVQFGHEVALSNSRGPESLSGVIAKLGSNARATDVEGAARFGDLVIEAIPFGQHRQLPRADLHGKLLISASNYFPQRDGVFRIGERAQTELIASFLPATTVVKAFNTIHWVHLRDQGDVTAPLEERRAIPMSGDDERSKEIAGGLIEAMGFGPLDLGSLREGKAQEPESYLFNRDLSLREAREWLRSGQG